MKIKILSTFLVFLLLPVLALATPSQCTSSQGLQINPSQIGVGDSFTATLVGSTTPTGENAVTMTATLQSLPTGITLVSGQNPQQHTGITSATSKTYSWSIRGDVADSYQISVQLKCSDDTGTLQDTYSGSATVVEGIVLDIDVTDPSSKSLTVSSGQVVTVKIWLSKSGEATANDVRATLTKPSGWSFVSGYEATQTVASLTGGQAFEWKLRVGGTSGSGTISLSATSGSPSASDTDSISWSCTDCTPTTTLGPGGPGAVLGGGPSEERKKSQIWTMITPGVAEIMHVNDPDIGLKQISINVRNRANNVRITVIKLAGKPANVVKNVTGKVYKYMEINAENLVDENISEVKIQFPVNKTWIIRNNIDRATVALNRYRNNVWERLQTREISEDNNYVYYEATSPGFTTFAISGEEIGVTTTTIATTTTTLPVTTTTLPIIMEIGGVPTWVIILLIVVVIAVVGVIVWRQRTKKVTLNSIIETPI